MSGTVRTLAIVLGDQLDRDTALLRGLNPKEDAIWMAEATAESEVVWSHKQRIALFLSAMRHAAEDLRRSGFTVIYHALSADSADNTLGDCLAETLSEVLPERVLGVHPGEWRVMREIEACCSRHDVPLHWLADDHFICSEAQFRTHARGRKQLRQEYFYREMRRGNSILMDGEDPCGGDWNFDKDNRETFGSGGPGDLPPVQQFEPDEITEDVLALVAERFSDHPGSLATFGWPVTPDQATSALENFLQCRLMQFGTYQDAMWSGEPFLYHSLLSSSLNLKLLSPLRVIRSAEEAYRRGDAPIASVEGFIRQILGWREYVRGIYWMYMPGYIDRNTFGASADLPSFFWTGNVRMNCLRQVISQTLDYGYAHHIQRLMVTGLFCLLFGVDPRKVHEWYLAIYVDAVEWVELPNTLGMSQFADGGAMASKPYAASGKYIRRMSNACGDCPFDPAQSTGSDACPITTLYWHFLARHRKQLNAIPRMRLQLRNLARLDSERQEAISRRADEIRDLPDWLTGNA